jgi:hypothetical protein
MCFSVTFELRFSHTSTSTSDNPNSAVWDLLGCIYVIPADGFWTPFYPPFCPVSPLQDGGEGGPDPPFFSIFKFFKWHPLTCFSENVGLRGGSRTRFFSIFEKKSSKNGHFCPFTLVQKKKSVPRVRSNTEKTDLLVPRVATFFRVCTFLSKIAILAIFRVFLYFVRKCQKWSKK